MSACEAQATLLAARTAGVSPGAFVAGLVAQIPVLAVGGKPAEHLGALVASAAELATLSRNIHHLTALLRHGSVRAAQEYREMLDSVALDVRRHLKLSATVLADLRPRRAVGDRTGSTSLE
jgi:hypothetical protein